MEYLTAFLAKLLQPLIEKAVAAAFEKFKEWNTEQNIRRIDEAVKHANEAKTDEEMIKAAREFAEANRNL